MHVYSACYCLNKLLFVNIKIFHCFQLRSLILRQYFMFFFCPKNEQHNICLASMTIKMNVQSHKVKVLIWSYICFSNFCFQQMSCKHPHAGTITVLIIGLTFLCPFIEASCNGVSFSNPWTLTLAPAFNNCFAMENQPRLLASCNGVHPKMIINYTTHIDKAKKNSCVNGNLTKKIG